MFTFDDLLNVPGASVRDPGGRRRPPGRLALAMRERKRSYALISIRRCRHAPAEMLQEEIEVMVTSALARGDAGTAKYPRDCATHGSRRPDHSQTGAGRQPDGLDSSISDQRTNEGPGMGRRDSKTDLWYRVFCRIQGRNAAAWIIHWPTAIAVAQGRAFETKRKVDRTCVQKLG